MASQVRTQPGTRKPVHAGHRKGHCLKILERLSAYLDDELAKDVCQEIRSHLGHCPNCEVFLDSLRQTVRLCQNRPAPTLSSQSRSTLRRQILKAAASA
ncbi:MAG: zf-HC2 domain-containing protein [Nitrospiraceae bacterium]|nr:zf-HC2 domain-containing protein [Nitrospiraceae bacterium]